jgi:hypothetical protein
MDLYCLHLHYEPSHFCGPETVQCSLHTHSVTSCKLHGPESRMPRWPEDAVLNHEVLCEQGPTLK